MTGGSLPSSELQALVERATAELERHAVRYPGDPGDRQPAHVVYGGANLFRRDSARRLGDVAIRVLDEYAPSGAELFEAIDPTVDDELADCVHARLREKLEREPVEDFRIDFEDGFGVRTDEEEDATARSAANETAAGFADGSLPPFVGIRIKPLNREWARRGLRTLDLFVTRLLGVTGGAVPPGFVVTLPKVVSGEQIAALASALESLEERGGLEAGSLRFEIMVETPQSLVAGDGRCPLPGFVETGRGRLTAAHFGVYDFTASTGITADYQLMQHPFCDAARQIMRIALSGTGVMLSDGATNLLPVARHRAVPDGPPLSGPQLEENRESVRSAWQLHYDDIRHSLAMGFYQGWDLHPAQLVTRYAAVYAFFLESLDAAADRLTRFVDRAARATLTGDVFDDAATGQGLLNFFLRGLSCGALTEEEVSRTGLSLEELRTRSFSRILEGRAG
ncbi:MAG: phosphoenolpyruvate kinase [Gemmatimonadota bacterium]|nr:phosphoenolpyruvate kinase [Gemmatimonadota bacterium]